MAVTKLEVTKGPRRFAFHTISSAQFTQVSPGAGVANTTIQAIISLPYRYKIAKVSACFTAIDSLAGADAFNLVLGTTASYSTAGASGSQTATVAGTWATADVVNATINGILSTFTVGATSTVTAVANGLVAAINANTATTGTLKPGVPLNQYISAANVAGVITLSTAVGDTNAYTLTVSKTSTSGTITAGGASFTAGTGQSGITQGANDNSFDSGNTSYGYTTNVAAAGVAVFPADIPITIANPYNTATGVGWYQLSTTLGGQGDFVPTTAAGLPLWDVVYPRAIPMTLRVQTPATSGSITNFQVTMCVEPQTLYPDWFDAGNPTTVPTPGNFF